MKKYLLSFIIGLVAITTAAQEQSRTSTDEIRKAMSEYDYSYAIEMIDSALVRRDTTDTEALRTLSLMKARCQKKLYKFGEACETLAPVALMEDIEVMGELADAYASDGMLEDALGTYYILARQQPGNLFFRIQILGLFNKMGSWNDCIAEGKSALQIDSLPQILSIVGHAYSKTGQVDSSLVYYEKALRMKPDNVGYLTSVCNLLLGREEYGDVVAKTGEYFVNVTPDEPEVESIYGFASYQMKNYGEAYKAFRKLKKDGDNSYATFYYAGLSSLALKKYKEAAEDFATAWQIDSSGVMLAANYGTALSRSYRQERALEMFDKATKLMAPDPIAEFKIAYGKGYSFYSMGKFAEAIPYYKRAYELDSSFISALSTMGFCYERCKDFASAKYWYEQYLSVGKPGTQAYQFVEQSLEYVNGELFMEE